MDDELDGVSEGGFELGHVERSLLELLQIVLGP